MNGSWRRALVAASVLLAAPILGCGKKPETDIATSIAQVRSQIAEVVPDSVRAEKIRSAYSRLGSALTETAKRQREISAQFRELCQRYGAPRESLEIVMAAQAKAASEFRDQAMSVREEVRSLTSEKEWKELAAGRKQLASLFVEAGK